MAEYFLFAAACIMCAFIFAVFEVNEMKNEKKKRGGWRDRGL